MIHARNNNIVYSAAASSNGIMLTIDNKINGRSDALPLPKAVQHYTEGLLLSFDDHEDIFFLCEKAIKISYNESKCVDILVILFNRETNKKKYISCHSSFDTLKNID